MQFKPQSEAEANGSSKERKLLPDGEYDFEVLDAEERYSAKGEPYISLKLGVWDQSGKQQWVFAGLNSSESMQWKLRHFAESVGILKDYESGNINPQNLLTLGGKCKIHSKKDLKGVVRNEVKDYIPRKTNPVSQPTFTPPKFEQKPAAPAPAVDDDDDSMPF